MHRPRRLLRPLRPRHLAARPIALAPVVAVALAACSDPASSLSLDDLRDAGDTCPVDAGDALADAGLDAAEAEVEVIEGSGDGGADASAIDRVGGVFVTCRWQSDDEVSLTIEVVGSESGGATALFLPAVVADLRVGADEHDSLAQDIASTDAGTPVDLGPDATVALAPISVEGAESGAVFVDAEGVPAAAVADAVLDQL